MGVREAQDGKPWLSLLEETRNLVQRLSREGTLRRYWVSVAWEEPVSMAVALLIAAVRATGSNGIIIREINHTRLEICTERERERERENTYQHHASLFPLVANHPVWGELLCPLDDDLVLQTFHHHPHHRCLPQTRKLPSNWPPAPR